MLLLEIPRDQFVLVVKELDEGLVEVLKLLSIPFRLNWDVLVRDTGQDTDVVREPTRELQVQVGIDGEILCISESDSSGNTPPSFQLGRAENGVVGWCNFVLEGVLSTNRLP